MSAKFCYECGAEKVWGHKFCGSCGKSFRVQPKANFVPNEEDLNIYKEHKIYLDKINSFENYFFFVFFGLAVLAMGTGFTRFFTSNIRESMEGAFTSTIVSFILIFFILIISRMMELDNYLAELVHGKNYEHKTKSLKALYQSLNSSKNNKGETICIFCGNSRFFRKGIYASNNCTVNCTKCQAYLFTE